MLYFNNYLVYDANLVKLMLLCYSFIGHVLNIRDLDYVLDTLKEAGFSETEWIPLGDALGLYHDTLDKIGEIYPGSIGRYITLKLYRYISPIEADHSENALRCLRVCLSKWLERVDDVDARGSATMTSLCDALEDIGERTAAENISKLLL